MEEAVRLTQELVRIDSTNPGAGEGGVEKYILEYMKESGAEMITEEVYPGRSNVRIRIAGEKEAPALILVCHMDTVVEGNGWNCGPWDAVMEQGRIYGRGACDMKSGLACALSAVKKTAEAVKAGRSRLKHPLMLLCTVDEEGEMKGIEKAIDSGWLKQEDWLLDLEPTNGQIQVSHKGRLWLLVAMNGITAHASTPQKGADAVAAAGEFICEMRRRIAGCPSHPEMGNTTVTFGQIIGGYQPYVVPDECRMWLDIRLVPPTDEALVLKMAKEAALIVEERVPGVITEIKVTGSRPYIEAKDNTKLEGMLKEACKKVTGTVPDVRSFPGYTDTAVAAARLDNPNCMSYGPGNLKRAHKPDEYVEIQDILRCEQVILNLIESL